MLPEKYPIVDEVEIKVGKRKLKKTGNVAIKTNSGRLIPICELLDFAVSKEAVAEEQIDAELIGIIKVNLDDESLPVGATPFVITEYNDKYRCYIKQKHSHEYVRYNTKVEGFLNKKKLNEKKLSVDDEIGLMAYLEKQLESDPPERYIKRRGKALIFDTVCDVGAVLKFIAGIVPKLAYINPIVAQILTSAFILSMYLVWFIAVRINNTVIAPNFPEWRTPIEKMQSLYFSSKLMTISTAIGFASGAILLTLVLIATPLTLAIALPIALAGLAISNLFWTFANIKEYLTEKKLKSNLVVSSGFYALYSSFATLSSVFLALSGFLVAFPPVAAVMLGLGIGFGGMTAISWIAYKGGIKWIKSIGKLLKPTALVIYGFVLNSLKSLRDYFKNFKFKNWFKSLKKTLWGDAEQQLVSKQQWKKLKAEISKDIAASRNRDGNVTLKGSREQLEKSISAITAGKPIIITVSKGTSSSVGAFYNSLKASGLDFELVVPMRLLASFPREVEEGDLSREHKEDISIRGILKKPLGHGKRLEEEEERKPLLPSQRVSVKKQAPATIAQPQQQGEGNRERAGSGIRH